MITIKSTTKKGYNMMQSAMNYDGYYLYDIYNSYSYEKQKAWEDCLNMCQKENGKNFHIFSHNSFNFSVAWEVENGIRIETSCNSYIVC